MISDPDLSNAIHTALLLRNDLDCVSETEADVVLADPRSTNLPTGMPIVMIGRPPIPKGETIVESREPALILATALLVGSGYRVARDRSAAMHLTGRERQVVGLLIEGASNKVIARSLDISVHTAKFHVMALFSKLGAQNRTDAVTIALREGIAQL